MGFAAYIYHNDSKGGKSYLKESPITRLEFSEHVRDAKEFVDQAAITTYLAARSTTLNVLGGTGTQALPMTHAGKGYSNRTE